MHAEGDINETVRIIDELGIPPCPLVLAEAMHEAARPAPELDRISRLLSRDAELSVAVLRAVNSPLHGLRIKVTTMDAVMAAIGVRRCAHLLAGLLLQRTLYATGDPKSWDATTQLSVVIAYLARELGVADFDEARTFGLFRHCGVPLMTARFAGYRSFFGAAHAEGLRDLAQRERARFGVDHAVAGSVLAKRWRLPESIWRAIRLHHVRDETMAEPSGVVILRLIAVGVLADCLDRRQNLTDGSDVWEKEEAFAYRVLGLRDDDLAPLRSDVALLLASN